MKLDLPHHLSQAMYRHQTGSQYGIMISKPPKPPSWRDFENTEPVRSSIQVSKSQLLSSKPQSSSKSSKQQSSSSHRRSRDLEFTDLGRMQQKSYSEGSDLSRVGTRDGNYNLHPHTGHVHSHTLPNPHTSSKSQRRHSRSHGRLHRTRSQYNLDQKDMPLMENLTVSLAETKPSELGLKRRPEIFDPRIYMDDNVKRCERWLQQVQASHPLEDIKAGNEEIIEENLSELGARSNENQPTSGSGSEIDSVSICAAYRTDLSEKEREDHIRLPVHPQTHGVIHGTGKRLPRTHIPDEIKEERNSIENEKLSPRKGAAQRKSSSKLQRNMGYSLEELNMPSAETSESKVGYVGTAKMITDENMPSDSTAHKKSVSDSVSKTSPHHRSAKERSSKLSGNQRSKSRNSSNSPRIQSSSKDSLNKGNEKGYIEVRSKDSEEIESSDKAKIGNSRLIEEKEQIACKTFVTVDL